MPRDYWHCPVCKGNFDHGEKCDCYTEKITPTMLEDITAFVNNRTKHGTCDVLVVGIDGANGVDVSCLTIGRRVGDSIEIVNTLYDKEANETYDILMNRGGVIKV